MEKFPGYYAFYRYDRYFKINPTVFDLEVKEPNRFRNKPLVMEMLVDEKISDSLIWLMLFNNKVGQTAAVILRPAGKNEDKEKRYFVVFNLNLPDFPIAQFAKAFHIPRSLRPDTKEVMAGLYSESRIRLKNQEIERYFIDGADCLVNFHGFSQKSVPAFGKPFITCPAQLNVDEMH